MHTNNKKSLGYPPFSEGGQKSSLDANSVKENRHNKIKKKKIGQTWRILQHVTIPKAWEQAGIFQTWPLPKPVKCQMSHWEIKHVLLGFN